jgi:hypothetical protein
MIKYLEVQNEKVRTLNQSLLNADSTNTSIKEPIEAE